jgi:hypothetical protein
MMWMLKTFINSPDLYPLYLNCVFGQIALVTSEVILGDCAFSEDKILADRFILVSGDAQFTDFNKLLEKDQWSNGSRQSGTTGSTLYNFSELPTPLAESCIQDEEDHQRSEPVSLLGTSGPTGRQGLFVSPLILQFITS